MCSALVPICERNVGWPICRFARWQSLPAFRTRTSARSSGGFTQPSVRVLRAIAEALNLSAETVLEQAGFLSGDGTGPTDTETAIRHDPGLTQDQKLALLSVYRSFRPPSGARGRPKLPRGLEHSRRAQRFGGAPCAFRL